MVVELVCRQRFGRTAVATVGVSASRLVCVTRAGPR